MDWAKLEADPRYQNLSWERQQAIRTQLLLPELEADQRFTSLDPERKTALLDQIISSWVPTFVPEGNKGVMFSRMFAEGMNKDWAGVQAMRAMSQAEAMKTGLQKNSLLAAFGMPAGAEYLGKTIGESFTGLLGLSKMPNFSADDANTLKFMEYVRQKEQANNGFSPTGLMQDFIAPIVGTGLDLAFPYAKVVGSIAKPAGLAKLVMGSKWIQGLTQGGTVSKFLYPFIRSGVHAVIGGTLQAGYETVKDLIFQRQDSWKLEDVASRSLTYLGQGALYDAVGFFIGGTLGRLGKAAQATFLAGKKLSNPLAYAAQMGEKAAIAAAGDKAAGVAFKLNLLGDILSGKTIDRAVIRRMGDEFTETVVNGVESYVKVARMASSTPPATDDVIRAFGAVNGLGAKKVGAGWEIFDVTAKKLGTFADDTNAFTFIEDFMKKPTDLPVKELGVLVGGSPKMELNAVITRNIPKSSQTYGTMLASTIAPVGGKFNPQGVKSFTEQYLRLNGATDDVLRGITVLSEAGDDLLIRVGGQEFKVPKAVGNPTQEIKAITDLTDSLSALAKKGEVRLPTQSFLNNYESLIKSSDIHYTPGWLQETATTRLGMKVQPVGNKFNVEIPSQPGVQHSFTSQEFGDFVLQSYLYDSKNLDIYLKNYENAALHTVKNGYQVIQGNRLVAKGATIPEVMQSLRKNGIQIKVPSDYGPQMTFVTDVMDKMQLGPEKLLYQNQIAFGNTETIMEELAKYRDIGEQMNKTVLGGSKVTFDRANKKFEIFVPEWNYRQTFDTQKEAMGFLQQSQNSFELFQYGANRKGYAMDTFKGKYRLYNEAGVRMFNTLDETKNFIRQAPMPEWAPELTGLETSYFKDMKHIPGLGEPSSYYRQTHAQPVMKAGWYIRRLTDTTHNLLDQAVKQGAPSGLLSIFHSIEDSREAITSKLSQALGIFDDIYKVNGRPIKFKERLQIGELLGHNLDDPNILKIVDDLGLKPEHLEVARQHRAAYDEMFKLFQVNPDKYVEEYVPRIRSYLAEKGAVPFTDADIEKFVSAATGKNFRDLPSHAQAFFKHQRVSDVVDMALERDPLNMTRRYIAVGLKEQILGPQLDAAIKFAKNNALGQNLMDVMTLYTKEVMGESVGLLDHSMEEVGKRIAQASKGKLGQTGLNTFLQLQYPLRMGFRLFTPVRNWTQLFIDLAPRMGAMGSDRIWSAMGKIKLNDEAFWLDLAKKGILQVDMPFFESGEILGRGSRFEKLSDTALAWIKNSDNYNRAVSYLAITEHFDDAARAFQGKRIDLDRFLYNSGLNNLDEVNFPAALKMIDSGDFTNARELLAKRLTDETMFVYRKGLMPVPFKGTIGKVFGTFGSFTVNHVQNLRRGLAAAAKGATGFRKIGRYMEYVASYGANAAMMGGIFYALGMRYDDFTNPVNFGGGPLFQMMVNALGTMNPTASGNNARKYFGFVSDKNSPTGTSVDLEEFMQGVGRNLVPSQAYNIQKAAEYMAAGDYYKAFLATMSAPIRRD